MIRASNIDHNYGLSKGNFCQDETLSAVMSEHPLLWEHFEPFLEYDLNIDFIFEFITKHLVAHTQNDALRGAHLQYDGGYVL